MGKRSRWGREVEVRMEKDRRGEMAETNQFSVAVIPIRGFNVQSLVLLLSQ